MVIMMHKSDGMSWRRSRRLFDNAVYRILDKDVKLEIYDMDDEVSFYDVFVDYDGWMFADRIGLFHNESDSEITRQLHPIVRRFRDEHRTQIPEGYEIRVDDHIASLHWLSGDSGVYLISLQDPDGDEYDDFMDEVNDFMSMSEITDYVNDSVRRYLSYKSTKKSKDVKQTSFNDIVTSVRKNTVRKNKGFVEIQRNNVSPKRFWSICVNECRNKGMTMPMESFDEWANTYDYNYYISTVQASIMSGMSMSDIKTLGSPYLGIMEFDFQNDDVGTGYFFMTEEC